MPTLQLVAEPAAASNVGTDGNESLNVLNYSFTRLNKFQVLLGNSKQTTNHNRFDLKFCLESIIAQSAQFDFIMTFAKQMQLNQCLINAALRMNVVYYSHRLNTQTDFCCSHPNTHGYI